MGKLSSLLSSPYKQFGLIVGLFLFVLGTVYWLQSSLSNSMGSFFILLGMGWLGLLSKYSTYQFPISVDVLEQNGIGRTVAQVGSSAQEPLFCQNCGKTFTTQPFIQGASLFCSELCKIASHTRLEKPRYFLHPPLPVQELQLLLEQAIQFGERAMRAASQEDIDRPLVMATHQGKGARQKIKKVCESLKIYNQNQWVEELQRHPAPEPMIKGGYQGDPHFFTLARELQQFLTSLHTETNPFQLFNLIEPIELADLQKVHVYDEQTQFAYQHLHSLLMEGEKELAAILSPLGLSR